MSRALCVRSHWLCLTAANTETRTIKMMAVTMTPAIDTPTEACPRCLACSGFETA